MNGGVCNYFVYSCMMKNFTIINQKFDTKQVGQVCPAVISFHCSPKNLKVMGNKIISPGWALEYHAKYAGKVFVKTMRNEYPREKQTVHLYAPGSIYWEDTRSADIPIQDTYFFFTGAEKCGLANLVSPKLKFARFEDPENIVGSLFAAAMRLLCISSNNNPFWLVQSCFMRIIHYLLNARRINESDYIVAAESAENKDKDFSRTVEEFLRQNIGRHLTLSEIARHLKISESLLSHRFKEETSISPMMRHAELRIEFAKNLILKGEKLKSVAEMTGYGDEYHLSKMFKKIAGVTPRIYRKTVL